MSAVVGRRSGGPNTRAAQVIQELNDLSGEERTLVLRALAKNHPQVLDTASHNPLTTEDIIQVTCVEKQYKLQITYSSKV